MLSAHMLCILGITIDVGSVNCQTLNSVAFLQNDCTSSRSARKKSFFRNTNPFFFFATLISLIIDSYASQVHFLGQVVPVDGFFLDFLQEIKEMLLYPG